MWQGIFCSYEALAAPATAINKFNTVSYIQEGGESMAHTYYWLYNLNVLGQVDTNITTKIPTYAVFNKNGTRPYAAYHPNSTLATLYKA